MRLQEERHSGWLGQEHAKVTGPERATEQALRCQLIVFSTNSVL